MYNSLDKKIFILLTMIFFHTVADYNLQGWLANAKCKSWWKKEAPDKKYAYDYIIALITHSFVWSFVMEIPIVIWLWLNSYPLTLAIVSIIVNGGLHAIIDNSKANNFTINLIQDQLLHILQIVLTWTAILWFYIP